jgi:hypothetical protein
MEDHSIGQTGDLKAASDSDVRLPSVCPCRSALLTCTDAQTTLAKLLTAAATPCRKWERHRVRNEEMLNSTSGFAIAGFGWGNQNGRKPQV